MASSTTMPRTRMSPKSVRPQIDMPVDFINTKVRRKETGIPTEANNAFRRPMASHRIKKTHTIPRDALDCSSFIRFLISRDWSK